MVLINQSWKHMPELHLAAFTLRLHPSGSLRARAFAWALPMPHNCSRYHLSALSNTLMTVLSGFSGPRGATGPQGDGSDVGVTGANGTRGESGHTGPRGSTGPTGDVGSTGATGRGSQGTRGLYSDCNYLSIKCSFKVSVVAIY